MKLKKFRMTTSSAQNTDRSFSEIKSDEDFRKYAHKVMKAAHGDEYSEEFTDKVVDDLLDDNKRATYGELIGRLTSGFGDKEFAKDGSSAHSNDRFSLTGESGLELTANGRRFRLTENDKYEYNMWLKSKIKTTRLLDQVFDGDASKYEEYMTKRGFSKKNFSAEAMKSGVTFDLMPTGTEISLPQLIGNLLLSVTACHMYHLCTTDYAAHMALDEYYNEMPDLVDGLAEHYIGEVANGAAITLNVSITPGPCPVEYLEALKAYCAQFSGEVASDYQSQIDAISEQIDSTLYKLKKLH